MNIVGQSISLVFVAVGSLLLTKFARSYALRSGLMDVPNDRSSHTAATPRGGGISIVVMVSVALAALAFFGQTDVVATTAIVASTLVVAAVGFVDDRQGLSARVRFLIQTVAVAPAVYVLGGLPELEIGSLNLQLGVAGAFICILGVLWFLNLFNFMDGIDGIAGCQAVFMTIATTLIVWNGGLASEVLAIPLTIAAASAGFLYWNWAPAKIFMGDVGSGYLGALLALVGLYFINSGYISVWVSVILGSLFICDATVTLAVRVFRRERWYAAHRTHVYQHLAKRWGSHSRAAMLYMSVNVFVVLPLAWWAAHAPRVAPVIAFALLASLAVAAMALEAGKSASVSDAE